MAELIVSGYGKVNTARVDSGTAKFTLQAGKNRFFVTANGVDQCALVESAVESGTELFVVGNLFSFVHHNCLQHHTGIDAKIILPVNAAGSMCTLIEQQMISNQARNGNGNGKISKLALV